MEQKSFQHPHRKGKHQFRHLMGRFCLQGATSDFTDSLELPEYPE